MRRTAVPLVIAATLGMIQCAPLRDGVIPTEEGYALSPDAFSVALIGDIPYTDRQIELLDELITEVNADLSVKLVMHAGDIKGSERCEDQLYVDRFSQFQQFQQAFIYTPGDNDWTDCHREDNGQFYPLERLTLLRSIFFVNPSQSTGGQSTPVRSQSRHPGFEPFVENVVFVKNGIVFATVHVVGSNNNLAPWSGYDAADSFDRPRRDRMEEFRAREEAALHWLHEIFRLARETQSSGVFILMHANPRFELDRDDEDRAGFNHVLETLRDLSTEYGKPVLLAHGDYHYLRIDKPMQRTTVDGQRERLQTLTRIQVPGSPYVRWVKLTVDPQSPTVFLFMRPIVRKHDSIP